MNRIYLTLIATVTCLWLYAQPQALPANASAVVNDWENHHVLHINREPARAAFVPYRDKMGDCTLSLDGEWRFKILREDACRIDFNLNYQMRSGLLAKVLGPLFGQISQSMVDAFVKRAAALAGD